MKLQVRLRDLQRRDVATLDVPPGELSRVAEASLLTFQGKFYAYAGLIQAGHPTLVRFTEVEAPLDLTHLGNGNAQNV